MPGAYVLKHTPTGKFYIGSSQDVPRRIWHHMWLLKNNRHHIPELQDIFSGEIDIETIVVSCDTRDQAYDLEQQWLDNNWGNPRLLNTCPNARSLLGVVRSEETRLKISRSNKGRIITDDQRERIRNTLKGRKLTAEHIENQTATRRNRPRTEAELEHLMRIQKATHKACVIEGIRYSSARAASRELDLPYQTVVSRLKSPTDKWKEWYQIDTSTTTE